MLVSRLVSRFQQDTSPIHLCPYTNFDRNSKETAVNHKTAFREHNFMTKVHMLEVRGKLEYHYLPDRVNGSPNGTSL